VLISTDELGCIGIDGQPSSPGDISTPLWLAGGTGWVAPVVFDRFLHAII